MSDDFFQASPAQDPPARWYRHPMVWLVIAPPALAVVAGFTTLWLALSRPDPVLAPDYYRRGLELSQPGSAKALLPAQTGRNHAMTPAEDLPPPRR